MYNVAVVTPKWRKYMLLDKRNLLIVGASLFLSFQSPCHAFEQVELQNNSGAKIHIRDLSNKNVVFGFADESPVTLNLKTKKVQKVKGLSRVYSEVLSMNSNGDLVGADEHGAFLLKADGTKAALGKSGNLVLNEGKTILVPHFSLARKVTKEQEVCGTQYFHSLTGKQTVLRPMFYTKELGMIDLGTPVEQSEGEALSLNETKTIVGYTVGQKGSQATVWNVVAKKHSKKVATNPEFLPLGEVVSSVALDINRKGEIVGALGKAGSTTEQAFFWSKEKGVEMIDLSAFNATASAANAINNFGVVAGVYTNANGQHAFAWLPGQPAVDLGVTDSSVDIAQINSYGVCIVNTADNRSLAIYTNNLQPLDAPAPAEGGERADVGATAPAEAAAPEAPVEPTPQG